MDSRLTRQRFVDRIESVRLRADWEEYCIDELGSPGMAQAGQRALDLLCSDDPRLYGFWDLMENFKDDVEVFDDFMGQLMHAVLTFAFQRQWAESADSAFHNSEEALRHFNCLYRILENNLWLDDRERYGQLLGNLALIKSEIEDWHFANKSEASGLGRKTLSRKMGSARHVPFMVGAVDLMRLYFGKGHLNIVANLVAVLYGVEVSEAAIQKAVSRKRERQRERIFRKKSDNWTPDDPVE